MKAYLLVVSLVCLAIEVTNSAFPNMYRKLKRLEIVGDPGEALFLTPLIEENKIEEAQASAEVDSSLFLGVKSYAGYFTVNDDYDSNMFFWFFPSESDYDNDPLVLWLQGGPGATSLFGLFEENGPFSVNSNLELEKREYYWSQSHSVIYIDNPVGTGYSFSKGGYAQNETQVGKDLYNALIQFLKLFPELQERDFYITGESYAGKYAPAIGYTILQENPNAELKINLQGIAMGNGYTDPVNQINYGDYLYQLGLIDINAREKLRENVDQVTALVEQGDYLQANVVLDMGISGTGFTNVYNYLYNVDPVDDSGLSEFVQKSDIRAAIHVGSTEMDSGPVYDNLAADVMQSVAPWVSELLSNYRVLTYNGQLDIIVAYPLTLNYLQKLDFDAADEYKVAERYIWYVGNDLAGYVKQAGNLTEILVRNAGHMVPNDQPKWAYDMISRFTRNEAFH